MRCVALISIALQTIICGAHVHPSAYNPVFEYDVPVASQPIIYAEPSYAVSHTYSQTQTHPVSYVKPVSRNNFFSFKMFQSITLLNEMLS